MVYFSNRCEQLLGVNGKLRQELMLIGEPIPELQERLGQLLQVLIQRYKHNSGKQLHSYRSSSRMMYDLSGTDARSWPHSLFSFSSLLVEKQPPQVIKTQSKFSTTVRYLLGEKIAPGKPVVLKAQIMNESQARNQGSIPGWVMQWIRHTGDCTLPRQPELVRRIQRFDQKNKL